MISRLLKWWHKRAREYDLEFLWPIFKKHARSIEHARAGFMIHASFDPAWTTDYSEEELESFIMNLE